MPGTFLPLLQVVFESILEVFLICLAGYILATQGVLDKKTQKQLNRLNVSLFTPCLLFSKVAFFLSPAKLRELWIIPIFFVVTTGVSMVVAYIFGWLLRLKKSQRSFAVAASMFMNSNSLPIALLQSLVITVPNLKWGDDDNVNAMVGRALTYLVLYSTMGMVLRWSYGVRLLSSADPEAVEELPPSPIAERDETAFRSSTEEDRILRHEPSSLTDVDDTKTLAHIRVIEGPKSFPSSRSFSPEPQPQASTSGAPSFDARDYSEEDDEDDNGELPMGRPISEPTSSLWQSRMRRTRNRIRNAWRTVHEFMTAPLWAALASLIVACIQPLQHILDVHTQPVKGALTAAGNCSIPLTLVVLGAYFYSPPDPAHVLPTHKTLSRTSSWASRATLYDHMRGVFGLKRRNMEAEAEAERRPSARRKSRPGETKTVVVAVLSRMVITPLLLLPPLALAAKYDVQRVFEDPVFVVANVLLIVSPPALTLAQITQAASGDAFERLISRTIFWSYCVMTPPSTILFVVVGLVLAKL